MRYALRLLEEPYRSRAVPAGTLRYWSWLFAAPDARQPLLGIYALMAEWRALMDPATDAGVAQIKLAWWREEMRRLAAGSPLHPISRFIAELPRAGSAELGRLDRSVEAAMAQVAGAPLERATELQPHAHALYGIPLLVGARFSATESESVQACAAALAAAEYLSRTIVDYGREARAGRVPFPVDELLTIGVDNDDLAATDPPVGLQSYLEKLRLDAASYYSTAAAALTAAERPELRHLPVLASLGARHLRSRRSASSADFRLSDLYNAWNAARRAAAAR